MAPRLHFILDVCEISRLINKEDADVNAKDVDGTTALHVARSSAVARTLIEYGADVNAKNSRGMSPLHRVHNVGVARILLQNGAYVDASDDSGNTPLHRSNNVEILRLLLQHSASVAVRNNKGETPIHTSTYGSKVLLLAKAGADINSTDNTGKTLLMKKARCFYVFRLLRELLSLNPAIFLKDLEGKTAIDFTIDDTVKEYLMAYGVQQNWRRRKTLVLLREKPRVVVVRDDFVLKTVELPKGLFRAIVRFL